MSNTPKVFVDNCKRCVCLGCMDRNTKYCMKYCDLCQKYEGTLNRKRCIYTPDYSS